MLLMVDTLCIIGFVMLQRLNPDLAFRQVEWFLMGERHTAVFLNIYEVFQTLGTIEILADGSWVRTFIANADNR